MISIYTERTSVVSPEIYALILTSKILKAKLLPRGLTLSPYKVLDYQAVLTLHDVRGVWATFRRVQRVRFVQDGVSAMYGHAWGDGVLLAHYHHGAGTLDDAFKDGNRRHLVIALRRPMGRGETLAFDVERTALAGFTRDEESLETTIDHPVERLGAAVVFPRQRPCLTATLDVGTGRSRPSGEAAGRWPDARARRHPTGAGAHALRDQLALVRPQSGELAGLAAGAIHVLPGDTELL